MIGLDFGTLSMRAGAFSCGDGACACMVEIPYAHGILAFPGHACADPEDYLETLYHSVPQVLDRSGIPAESVIGIGIDATACSLLPLDRTGAPLSRTMRGEPHAQIRLWKDHSADPYARRINREAERSSQIWLRYCGGAVSAEWQLPKLLQTFCEKPEVVRETGSFADVGDWIVSVLTGSLRRSTSISGFVGNRMEEGMFPSDTFLDGLASGFSAFCAGVLSGEPVLPCSSAGRLSGQAAWKMGLQAGIPVAAANIDSQAGCLSVSMEPTDVYAVLGTSGVYLAHTRECIPVRGAGCTVRNGVFPGLSTISAGQSAVGDTLNWCARTFRRSHAFLTRKALAVKPGQHGLAALDWFNGNRAVLRNMLLSGAVIGLRPSTGEGEIYRALIESTAFGCRRILEAFREAGIPADRLIAVGGIPAKNGPLMRIWADVLGIPIEVPAVRNGSLKGSAVSAAVAAVGQGGFPGVSETVRRMDRVRRTVYEPDPANAAAYDVLYGEYVRLYELFGERYPEIMETMEGRRSQ